MSKISADIEVACATRDGWAVYTSRQLPGLYLSSQDDKAVYEDLPLAIQKLIEIELGVKVTVLHKWPYDAFVQRVSLSERARHELAAHIDELCSDHTMSFTVTESIRAHERHQ